jgi:hypothetical protein
LRFPSLNVHQRQEAVATDTIFSDTPAVDNGSTCAQIFVGMDTLVTDAYGIKYDGKFVSTLEDNIRKQGAMSKLNSDCAQLEVSNKVSPHPTELHDQQLAEQAVSQASEPR